MKTKEAKRANRPSLSTETLATEIKNTQTQFEMSCHRLVSLADRLEDFPNSFMDAVELLEKMQRQARQGNIKGAGKRRIERSSSSPAEARRGKKISRKERKKAYRALKTLRAYSRMVASEDEPLNCIDACESASVFEDHLAELRRVVSSIKRN